MKTVKWLAIFASVMALLALGCGRTPLNITGAPVVTNKRNATPDEVATAIIRAGVNTNWRITQQSPGQLVGIRMQGSHSATVNIAYSPENYSITLKESSLGDADRVHKVFNRWVLDLDMQIKSQLSAL